MQLDRINRQKILNHVEREITAIYDRHSYDVEKWEALEAWAQRLMKILSVAPIAQQVGSTIGLIWNRSHIAGFCRYYATTRNWRGFGPIFESQQEFSTSATKREKRVSPVPRKTADEND